MRPLLVCALASLLAALPGCFGCGPAPCSTDEDCTVEGEICIEGACAVTTGDGDVETDGGSDGGIDEVVDAGPPPPPTEPIREPDVNDPNNANLDSDCDGLTDLEEFTDTWAAGRRTDPADYDSDNDGIADGIEAARTESRPGEPP